MDMLAVTMDALYAAIDRFIATKERLLAVKEIAFTAKNRSIVRMVDHIAVKSMDCERSRVVFAVIRV